WEIYGIENIDEQTLRRAGYTYNIFLSEYFSTKAAHAGIMKIPAYILHGYNNQNSDEIDHTTLVKPAQAELVRHFRWLDKHEISIFDHLKPTSGFVMSTITVEVKKYLLELQRFLTQNNRVKIIKKKIHSLDELKNTADVIINCSGITSKYLVGDETVRPARGQ
ncbi:unnamed protein product, partial [Adineta steineri]